MITLQDGFLQAPCPSKAEIINNSAKNPTTAKEASMDTQKTKIVGIHPLFEIAQLRGTPDKPVKKELTAQTFTTKSEKICQLHKYTLASGQVYKEAVQYQSDTHVFLALKDENDNWVADSPWFPEEIERMSAA